MWYRGWSSALSFIVRGSSAGRSSCGHLIRYTPTCKHWLIWVWIMWMSVYIDLSCSCSPERKTTSAIFPMACVAAFSEHLHKPQHHTRGCFYYHVLQPAKLSFDTQICWIPTHPMTFKCCPVCNLDAQYVTLQLGHRGGTNISIQYLYKLCTDKA